MLCRRVFAPALHAALVIVASVIGAPSAASAQQICSSATRLLAAGCVSTAATGATSSSAVIIPTGITGPGLVSAPPAPAVGASGPHRFFDSLSVALTGVESAALLADGYTTQRALTQYPESVREANPIARPFVSQGWPGQIAGGLLLVSADVATRYVLHRTGHHRFERVLPLIFTACGTAAAVHNSQLLVRLGQVH
jgi:hypothetical protein